MATRRANTETPGRRIRVRRRDGGTALEIDGTWASHRLPGRATTASVWDALALPLLALGARARAQPRVLVLGLGGGSVARVLRALAPDARLVGVEFDPEVVRVARRVFDLDELGVEVLCEDARDLLRRTRRRFDLVVDDVFVGAGESPCKPPGFPTPALERAAALLDPGGILVSNSLDEARAVLRAQRALWRWVLELRVDGYDNRIFAGAAHRLDARRLRRAIAASPLRDGLPALHVRRVS